MQLNKNNTFYLWSVLLLVTILGIHGCGHNIELGMTNDQQESSGPRKRKLPTSPSSPEPKRARSINLEEVPLVSLSPSTLPPGQSSSSVVYPAANISSQQGVSTLASSSSIESASGEKAKRPLEQGFAAPPAKRARPSEEQEEVFSQGSLSPEADVCETASLKERNEALINAASKGDYGTVQRLLSNLAADRNFVNIDAQYEGYTALIKAIEGGYIEIVQLLLGHKADIEIGGYPVDREEKSAPFITPLSMAAEKGNIEIFQLLLDAEMALKEKIEKLRRTDRTPLSKRVSKERHELQESRWNLAFTQALRHNHPEVIELLINNGLSRNFALRETAAQGNLALLQSFLKDSIDIDAQDENGFSALMLAIKGEHATVVQELLIHKADISRGHALQNQYGGCELIAPLALAAGIGNIEIFNQILAAELALRKAEEQKRESSEDSLDEVSIEERHKVRENRWNFAFTQALKGDHIAIGELLINSGLADLNLQVEDGMSVLMWTLRRTVESLKEVKKGTLAEVSTIKEHDALVEGEKACLTRFEKVMQLLLANGADPNLADNEGKTALAWVIGEARAIEEESSMKLVQLLVDGGADVNINLNVDGIQTTVLIWAISQQTGDASNIELVQKILAKGADVSAKDENGKTALQYAGGNYEIATLLRQQGTQG